MPRFKDRELLLIITTTDNARDANRISRSIIEAGLGACAQISKIRSIYKWQGQIKEEDEYKITIKTYPKNYKRVEEQLLKVHNYSLPQIIGLAVDAGSPDYIEWAIDQLK